MEVRSPLLGQTMQTSTLLNFGPAFVAMKNYGDGDGVVDLLFLHTVGVKSVDSFHRAYDLDNQATAALVAPAGNHLHPRAR